LNLPCTGIPPELGLLPHSTSLYHASLRGGLSSTMLLKKRKRKEKKLYEGKSFI
jgi:hypothetical protein